MTRNMILPALSATLLLLACKNQPDGTRDNTSGSNGGDTNTQDTRQWGGTTPADSLVIALERTPCFGMCPAYRLNVYRSGYATYEGVVHVERVGRYEGRIAPERIESAVARAEEIGFFRLNDVYDSPVTDLPSTIIRVVAGGRDKQVTGRVEMPNSFRNYTTFLEEQLLPTEWRAVKGEH